MSAAIAEVYKPLPNSAYKTVLGDIFLVQPRTLVLRCSMCEEEHQTCQEFLEHIFVHYGIKDKLSSRFSSEGQESSEPTEHSVEQSDAEFDDTVENAAETDDGDDGLFEPMDYIDVLQPEDSCDEESEESSRKNSRIPLPRVKVPKRGPQNDENNERRFKCNTCGIMFRRKGHLREHLVRHTGVKPFPCEQCDKAFYTRNELGAHKRHHSGERPFICTYCGARFTTSGWRMQHEKKHELRDSNLRPYKCDQCDKAFFDTAQLKRHAVVHTRERNHICSVCNAAFMRRKDLIQHIKRHGTERKFVCILCSKGYTDKTALQQHQKRNHDAIEINEVHL